MSTHQVSVTLQDTEIFWAVSSLRLSLSLEGRDVAEFDILASQATPQVGQKIGVFDQGIRIFGGTVQDATLRPVIKRPAAEAVYRIVATGWQHRLERHKIPALAFSSMAAGTIVETLLDYVFLNYNEEIHKGEILPGAPSEDLGVLIFRGLSFWDAIQELAQRSNFVAFIDPDLFLYFVPRDWQKSTVSVDASTKNYRDPEVRYDRAEYFNAASIAISLEAFAPYVPSLQGDESYPSFNVFDPNDVDKTPLPIEAIRAIKLNGVEQDYGIRGTDTGKVFYYTPGLATIHWDEAQPEPSPDDVITVEFWQVGQNVITVEDETEQAAVEAIEGSGSGRYHAFFEDLEITDTAAARAKLNAFLNDHAPGRRDGGTPGESAVEYNWVMFSKELIDPADASWRISDIRPGKKIAFAPSTPISTSQDVLIQSVDISHEGDPTQFRYEIKASHHAPIADDLEFYKTLAEIPVDKPDVELFDPSKRPHPRIVFDLSGAATTGVVTASGQPKLVEVTPGVGNVFRCRIGFIHAGQAPAGSSIKAHLEYSTDDEDTAYASRTWTSLFVSSDGDLELPADQIQMTTPLGKFNGFPDALDLPHRTIVRCDIKQIGSTTAGSNVHIQIVGEIRAALAAAA